MTGLLQSLFIVFGLLISSAVVAASGADLTRSYQALYKADCALRQDQILALRKHKVLLIPGYFSNFEPAHFAEHMQWFTTIGVAHEKVNVQAGQSTAVNAAIVATAIRQSTLPVILISHSKGSVDTLEALRTEPTLQPKVKGWVSLQGVFFGSPIADMLLDENFLNPLFSTLILGFFGGTKDGAQGLTTTASSKYYQNHKTVISAIVRDIPNIAFASALDAKPGTTQTTQLELPHDLMRRVGIPNDGLVPIDSAVIPGMNFIKVSGVDHIAPVMPAMMKYDRIRMTKALLLLLQSPYSNAHRESPCSTPR